MDPYARLRSAPYIQSRTTSRNVANSYKALEGRLSVTEQKSLDEAIDEAKAVLAAEAPKISRRMNGAKLPEMAEAVKVAKQLEKAIEAGDESLMRRLTFSVKQASKRADEAEKQAKEKVFARNYARQSTASAQESVRNGTYRNRTRVVEPNVPNTINKYAVSLVNARLADEAMQNSRFAATHPNYNYENARRIGPRQKVPNNDKFLRNLAAFNKARYGKGGRRITRSRKAGRKSGRKTRGGRKTRRKPGRKTRRAL